MEMLWNRALWRQVGAAFDMLENALVACPDSLWTERLWRHSEGPEYAEFWYIVYHTLFWTDLYLSGVPEEDFAPPAPFTRTGAAPTATSAKRPYTKNLLRAYLTSLRQKCRDTLIGLTNEQANRLCDYPWIDGQPISFLEIQIYNLRHIQEHMAQLSLFLGQQGAASDEALDWVARARDIS